MFLTFHQRQQSNVGVDRARRFHSTLAEPNKLRKRLSALRSNDLLCGGRFNGRAGLHKKILSIDCAQFGYRSFFVAGFDSTKFKFDVEILVKIKTHSVSGRLDFIETVATNPRVVSNDAVADTRNGER